MIDKVFKFYRIQGGILPNFSNYTISVNNSKIELPTNISLYVGSMEHSIYFLQNRLGIKSADMLLSIKPKNKEHFSNQNIEVVEMHFPYWVFELINTHAEPQKVRDKSFPKLVDRRTPGLAYQLNDNWSELFKISCLYATQIPIRSVSDVIHFVFDTQPLPANKYKPASIWELTVALAKCDISPEIVSTLDNKYKLNLDLDFIIKNYNKKHKNEDITRKKIEKFNGFDETISKKYKPISTQNNEEGQNNEIESHIRPKFSGRHYIKGKF